MGQHALRHRLALLAALSSRLPQLVRKLSSVVRVPGIRSACCIISALDLLLEWRPLLAVCRVPTCHWQAGWSSATSWLDRRGRLTSQGGEVLYRALPSRGRTKADQSSTSNDASCQSALRSNPRAPTRHRPLGPLAYIPRPPIVWGLGGRAVWTRHDQSWWTGPAFGGRPRSHRFRGGNSQRRTPAGQRRGGRFV